MIGGARRKTLVAFAAGALSVAGFGDLPLWPLSLLSLATLFWLWRSAASPRQAGWYGYASGRRRISGRRQLGVREPARLRHDAGPLAAIATVLFCLYLALFPPRPATCKPACPALRPRG